ncbi:MAG: helix-turn-helix domain-containing protein [Candidatus Hodarchaeales archaeon]
MIRTRGSRYELKVNNKEHTLLYQCSGTARFAWNWGLADRNARYHNMQSRGSKRRNKRNGNPPSKSQLPRPAGRGLWGDLQEQLVD